MKSRLDQIEEKIRELFEGSSTKFPWVNEYSLMVNRLGEAIQDCIVNSDIEGAVVPSRFQLYMNREGKKFLEHQKGWEEAFATLVIETAAEHGLRFEKTSEFTIVVKNSLNTGEVQVKGLSSDPLPDQTGAMPIKKSPKETSLQQACNKASLLLEGEILYPLEKPVINIGRKSNNHLVINDLRVSRTHAQIRAVQDGFLIFDIGSSGGTYINGERINQKKLKPGDVISLAGVKLIYIEDQLNLLEEARQITSELKSASEEV